MRHNTKQAEVVLEFLVRMEADCGNVDSRPLPRLHDRLRSGTACATHRRESNTRGRRSVRGHRETAPDVHFVSETGVEDMKILVYMQPACSGGTGIFVEADANALIKSGMLLLCGPDGGPDGGLAAVLPLSVRGYAGQLQNLAAGRFAMVRMATGLELVELVRTAQSAQNETRDDQAMVR